MAETFFQEGDVQALINNAGGVSVTVGAVTANGLRDITDEAEFVVQAGTAIGRQVSVLVKTGTFPALALGASITVEGTAYRVVDVRRIEDGALTRVLCAEP